ncbi:MAG: TIGR04283 family arsenosugar biosynthesis glycosyltransferase, partial [Psychrobacter sp.]|nr:TIGR04283 family arsenosugar biosynthesis glycosyltransferase [Psychrobacter sp.]
MITVSIIIPILNEADNLPFLFENITSLNPAPQQILLVDGGSTDRSIEVAKALISDFLSNEKPNIKWQVIESMAGRAVQMNVGAAQATSDVLLFLHADTQLPMTAINDISLAMKRADSNYEWGRFDVRLDSRNPILWAVGAMMNGRSRLTGIATGDQAIFIKNDLFKQIGGYHKQPLMEDIELCKSLQGIAKPACLSSKVITSARRWQQHGTWQTILLMWQLRFDYWRGESA